jgi:hypothetical protein
VITPSPERQGFSGQASDDILYLPSRTPDPSELEDSLSADHITLTRPSARATVVPATRQVLRQVGAAGLAGPPPIHHSPFSAGTFCLVRELRKEGIPTGIADRTGQPSARETFEVQVLHRNPSVAGHQPRLTSWGKAKR